MPISLLSPRMPDRAAVAPPATLIVELEADGPLKQELDRTGQSQSLLLSIEMGVLRCNYIRQWPPRECARLIPWCWLRLISA
jgi:hypothetical protein